MKDIGKSRRKDKRNRQVSLELPESIGEASTSSESELPFRCAAGQQGTFQKFELAGHGPTPASNAEVGSCTSFYPLDSTLYFQPSDSEHAAPEYLQQTDQDCSYDSPPEPRARAGGWIAIDRRRDRDSHVGRGGVAGSKLA